MNPDDSPSAGPRRLTLIVLPERYAICRLEPDRPIPAWFRPGPLAALTYTDDELSMVVPEADAPPEVAAERGWRAFKVLGPLDFALTGVLASIAAPLASARASLFAVSTYDTDYVLVKADDLPAARAALGRAFDIVG